MKIITMVILAGLAYGLFLFLRNVVSELTEIAAEAWHSGETGR